MGRPARPGRRALVGNPGRRQTKRRTAKRHHPRKRLRRLRVSLGGHRYQRLRQVRILPIVGLRDRADTLTGGVQRHLRRHEVRIGGPGHPRHTPRGGRAVQPWQGRAASGRTDAQGDRRRDQTALRTIHLRGCARRQRLRRDPVGRSRPAAGASLAGDRRRISGVVRQSREVDQPHHPHRPGRPRRQRLLHVGRTAPGPVVAAKSQVQHRISHCAARRVRRRQSRGDRLGRRLPSAVEGKRLRAVEGGAARPGAVPLLLSVRAVRGAQGERNVHHRRYDLDEAAAVQLAVPAAGRGRRRGVGSRCRRRHRARRIPLPRRRFQAEEDRRCPDARHCTVFRTEHRADRGSNRSRHPSPSTPWWLFTAASHGMPTTVAMRD